MHSLLTLLRTWKLPIAMLLGVAAYFLLAAVVPSGDERPLYTAISHVVQPCLIFTMLTLSFLKVEPRNLKPHRWHVALLAAQGGAFVLCSIAAIAAGTFGWSGAKILAEGAMLCFICPTATASAVIVPKLGGSTSGVVTYLVLCNLLISILAPAMLTLVAPTAALGFWTEATMIMGKVFPLLLCPLLLALVIRHYFPTLMRRMLAIPDLAFYLWLVALALAITVTVRAIVESDTALAVLVGLAVVSAVCCAAQFWLGRRIGSRWQQPTKAPLPGQERGWLPARQRSAVTAGQAFGQKNTVFIIWMGLVFLDPVTSVVGGFYSVFHNVVNSWQLYRRAGAA